MSQRDLRESLHAAFSYVKSCEANKATSSITFDHIIDQQIAFLRKDVTRPMADGRGRASRYDRLLKVKEDLDAAVEVITGSVEL